MRQDAKVEDKARSKRLFGNLLGTLQQFKKDDKNNRGSEAVSGSSRLCTSPRVLLRLLGDVVGIIRNDLS